MVDDVIEDNPSPIDGIERGLPLDTSLDTNLTLIGGADPEAIVPPNQPPLRSPDTPNPPASPPEGEK